MSALADDSRAETDIYSLSLQQLLGLKVVSSATGNLSTMRQSPASVTIVSQKDIKYYGYRDLADIIAAERSFYTNYDRNYSYVGSRGISQPGNFNTRFLILINGKRTNDSYYEQAYFGTPFPVDLHLIDYIEIIRGSNSALYGSNAVLATINIVTLSPDKGHEVIAELGFGSQSDEKYSVTWLIGNDDQNTSHSGLISYTQSTSDGETSVYSPEFDSPSTNNGRYLNNDFDEFEKWYAQYHYEKFAVSGYYSSRKKGIPTASYATLFNAEGSFTQDEKYQVNLEYTADLSKTTQLYSKLWVDYYHYTGDYIYDYPPITTNRDNIRSKSRGLEQKLTYNHNNHFYTIGYQYIDDYSFSGQNFDVSPFASYLDISGNKDRKAIFIQDEAQFNNWEYVLGVRWDDYDSFGDTVNPRLALIHTTSSKNRIKFLAGRSFRAPSISEQERAQFFQQDPIMLSPEKNISIELIYEQYINNQSQFNYIVFQNEISDSIIFGETSTTGFGLTNDFNNHKVNGIEFAYIFKKAKGLNLDLNYTFSNLEEGSNAIFRSYPEHQLKLKAYSQIFNENWIFGITSRYQSEILSENNAMLKEYIIGDATITYRGLEHQGWNLRINIQNLADKSYKDPVSLNLIQNGLMQDGRTYMFNAEYRFN